MKFNNRQNKCVRTVDGDEVWNSRSVAVVGMILMRHEGEIYVLIGKRGEALPNEVGKWCMPCGFLDFDETCEEAVVREVWEETGLNLYKATEQYHVIYDHLHYPWKIHSIPDGEAQTVSLHYAIYMDTKINMHRDIAVLPELSIENQHITPETAFPDRLKHYEKEISDRIDFMIKNNIREVDEVKWARVDDLPLYDMAFNHDKTIKVFVNNLPPYED